jgi:hypothetical protein
VCLSTTLAIRSQCNENPAESQRLHPACLAYAEDPRELSKPRLCQRLGAFQPAPAHQLEAARTATLVRFDFYGDESGNEAVATKKGSY